MTEAWTSASDAEKPCAGGADVTGVGGVAPYHHSYSFDSAGNRLSQTVHAVGSTPAVERRYKYPASGTTRPHAVGTMTEKTTAGDRLFSYKYDDAGNTSKRTEVGEDQDLTWDPEGNLASVTKAGKTTSYIYSADGARMVRREPGATTVYLGGQEVRLDAATGALSGTRFYPVGNQAMVVRTNAGLQFQFADHHGTGAAAVDPVSGAITHRRTDPFGNPRGQQPAAGVWSGEKGFVGGNHDTSTGLTQLGARLYDPVNGRFISPDPLIDPNDPQQMNAYAYSNNSPVTFTDPTG
ncbi:MAG TPA: RHS repeat-associated core domain-containing protein, partial [Actinoplanes sp.]